MHSLKFDFLSALSSLALFLDQGLRFRPAWRERGTWFPPKAISTILTDDLHSLVPIVEKNHEHRFSAAEGARQQCIVVGVFKSKVGLSIKLFAGRQRSGSM